MTFSEPPLDDEDDEPLTRPSSGFSPSPQPLTSTQKPQGQKMDDKQSDQKQTGKIQSLSWAVRARFIVLQDNLPITVLPSAFAVVKRKNPLSATSGFLVLHCTSGF